MRGEEGRIEVINVDRGKENFRFMFLLLSLIFLSVRIFLSCSSALLSVSFSHCVCLFRRSCRREDNKRRSGKQSMEMLGVVEEAERRKIY